MTSRRPGWFVAATVLGLAFALAFLFLPIVGILADVPPGELVSRLDDGTSLDALRLSLETTAISLGIIVAVGTPVACLLATRRFRGRALVETLLELPLVLPPAVAGIGLLAAFGPQGLLGSALDDAGLGIALTTGGVVAAQTFVASPFYLRQAQAAFGALDPALAEASRTLGAGEAATFGRVVVPGAAGGLVTGAALAWGRALGEFGATLIVAGSFRGISQTAPLAIFASFSSDFTAALALSAVLLAVSGALLLGVKLLTGEAAP
ncbi:MAG: molybdate ABC transporter permease subunit [Actinobacteria bacterium]|nr:MAG: molybdate ABC transporter permease subunit [Actinomycetota bacterium]